MSVESDWDLAGFAASLADDKDLFLELCTEGVKQIAEDTHNILIKSTPVATGVLKASWVLTLDQGTKATRRKKKNRTKRGQVVFTSDQAAQESLKTQGALDALDNPFTDVYLTNPQYYASFVDVGAQAPKPRSGKNKPNTPDPNGGVKAYNMTQLAIAEMQGRAYVIGEQ